MSEDKNLYYLDELSDYKVAEDDCDVRGWDVKDADDRVIGKVEDLMVNKKAERVVYIDVAVKKDLIEEGHQTYATPASEGIHEFLDKDGDDHIIIPVGMVTLDEKNEAVLANKINASTFAKTNRFSKGTVINREYEITLMRNYIPANIVDEPSTISNSFYDGKEFENTLSRKKN
ncbi:MAG: PRC-barrel domain-containing protein [Bacteroidota bacterium]|nr:PRC-barrel domain-containing protein [Bacteroidota bacterium]